MKRFWGEAGYTIAEVMIVLAVSGGLLVSVMTTISGQQRRTTFQTGVRDFQSTIQDVMNDVETGYFANNGTPGTSTNKIFIGKAFQFYQVNGETTGLREIGLSLPINAGTTDTVGLNDSNKGQLDQIDGSLSERILYNNIEVKKILFGVNTPEVSSYGFAVISGTESSGGVTPSGISGGTTAFKSKIGYLNISSSQPSDDLLSGAKSMDLSYAQAAKGYVFCLKEAGGDRIAAVSYGIVPSSNAAPPTANGQTSTSETYFDSEAEKLGCTE